MWVMESQADCRLKVTNSSTLFLKSLHVNGVIPSFCTSLIRIACYKKHTATVGMVTQAWINKL